MTRTVTIPMKPRSRHQHSADEGAPPPNARPPGHDLVVVACYIATLTTPARQVPGLAQTGTGRKAALALHPTVKPVALLMDAILDTSTLGGIVLDPFAGSGSTLIAAHRTKRVGYGIELDPKYVDVAVARMERITGKPAIHLATGLTFAAISEQRHGRPLASAAAALVQAWAAVMTDEPDDDGCRKQNEERQEEGGAEQATGGAERTPDGPLCSRSLSQSQGAATQADACPEDVLSAILSETVPGSVAGSPRSMSVMEGLLRSLCAKGFKDQHSPSDHQDCGLDPAGEWLRSAYGHRRGRAGASARASARARAQAPDAAGQGSR